MSNTIVANKKLKAPKKMYQHTIPRFILRQFDVSYEPLPSQVKKDQEIWRQSKRYHAIHFYNLENGCFTIEDLGSVYGETNLYRNQKEPRDVDYLEHRLGNLEQHACSAIKLIHYGILCSSVTFTRAELVSLRKFVFLTHYRSAAASVSYFCESDPRNASLVDWIESLKTSHGLETDDDVWKEGLKYYLDTSHEDIIAAGQALRYRYGEQQLQKMLQSRVDPELEEWYAIDYENQAKNFCLGIWEAATGSEFVLSENGSGIWDRLIYGSPGTHKIYVVQVTYSEDLSLDLHPTPNKLRPSLLPETPDDRFIFKFTKLSFDQTYSVNEVLLRNANVKHRGSITFLSCRLMLQTLKRYLASGNPALLEEKALFRPLVESLSSFQSKMTKEKSSQGTNL
ncbi:hypothetical protein CPB83DRAFT_646048 [Crepidotus variabilis]|uniref:DUF4238 domain-containing protein n=1 Tax=Crepidotus variabilis TaxID=179855 RepID=A0A9P6E788_9AGAR|nr:hypothetical protein CPB83DRAFT_646048 [Crepidotus variabilis]